MSTSRPPAGAADPAEPRRRAEDAAQRHSDGQIDFARIDWRCLSPEGRATLREIAVPVSLGLAYKEISARSGVSRAKLASRMRQLREELREAMREPGDDEISPEEAFGILLDAAQGDVARVAYALDTTEEWVEGRLRDLGLEPGEEGDVVPSR